MLSSLERPQLLKSLIAANKRKIRRMECKKRGVNDERFAYRDVKAGAEESHRRSPNALSLADL